MNHALRLGCVLALIGLAPALARAGTIRGTVRLGGGKLQAAAARAGARAPRLPKASVTNAVVYLDAIPDKLEKKLARKNDPVTMGQAYGRFSPSPLVVAAGTTVQFENQDRVYHNVFSISPVQKFDIGKYAPRQSRDVRFDKPGEIKLFCDIDPGETGWLYVTPNHAFTHPDSAGAYELPKLPQGTYQLRVWYPGRARVTRTVEMPKKGDVTLDVKL